MNPMNTDTQLAILVALGTAMLAACSSKPDANERNFGAAMDHYFEKRGDLCLSTKTWPLDLKEFELRFSSATPTSPGAQMAALEAAGLVKSEEAEIAVSDFLGKPTGRKVRVKRYTLTDAAKPFMKETAMSAVDREVSAIKLHGQIAEKQADLCWGTKALDKVVKWEGPIKLGDYQEASVTYLYKVNNVAEWAKRADVQAAFPSVKSILDAAGAKPATHAIKLTSLGWEAKGLD